MLRAQIMRMSEMGNKTGQREMRIQMRGALSHYLSLSVTHYPRTALVVNRLRFVRTEMIQMIKLI